LGVFTSVDSQEVKLPELFARELISCLDSLEPFVRTDFCLERRRPARQRGVWPGRRPAGPLDPCLENKSPLSTARLLLTVICGFLLKILVIVEDVRIVVVILPANNYVKIKI
jgi:hypothetical protein